MSESERPVPLTEAQQALVSSVPDLVRERVAWHVSRTGATSLASEMKSAGDQALVECARRFSAKWQTSFRTFASYRVNGAILDVLRAEGRQRGLRLAARAAARWGIHVCETASDDALDPMRDDEVTADQKLRRALKNKALSAVMAFAAEVEQLASRQVDPEDVAVLLPPLKELRQIREGLTDREQLLLRCVYDQGMDLHDTATEVGLAYPTVKVLHAKLLHRLRDTMAARGVPSPFSPG